VDAVDAEDSWRAHLEESRRQKDEAFRHAPDSPIPPWERASFAGLSYFPPDPRYRFEAPLVEEPRRRVDIERSGGDAVAYVRLGHFELRLPDGEARLALYKTGGHAFLPFRDATSGKETYGAGRYLDPPQLPDGRFEVDFNRAYNPFCAYSEAYSCPFPPAENWLAVPVRAGEKAFAPPSGPSQA
jgi:uncharacterized protein (DUF1684 family)